MLCIQGRSVEYVIIWLRVVLRGLSFVRPRQREQKSNKKKMVFSRLWYVFFVTLLITLPTSSIHGNLHQNGFLDFEVNLSKNFLIYILCLFFFQEHAFP